MSRASPILSADGVDLRTHGGYLYVVSNKHAEKVQSLSIEPEDWYISRDGSVMAYVLTSSPVYVRLDMGETYATRMAALTAHRDAYLSRAQKIDQIIREIRAAEGGEA